MAASNGTASRVEVTTAQLREGIFQGRFSPGMPLRELTLAHDFQVSQATIREALRSLEHAGLVTKEANRGSTVTRLTPRDIRERVALRAALESVAAQSAAVRMGPDEFHALYCRLQSLDDAVRSDHYHEAAQADLEFHRYIWACSGNTTLGRTLEWVAVPLFAFISILRSQGVQRLTTVVEAHEPLIAALKSKDPAVINSAFKHGATSAYQSFLDDGTDQAFAIAFGLLHPIR